MFVSSGIGLVAKIGAIVSLLEGRKRTKHLETMIKTLPYTTKKKRNTLELLFFKFITNPYMTLSISFFSK
jgi:hypothetical protein